MKIHDYPIKRPIDESECEECGAPLRVGMVAFETDAMLFCSEECAALQVPTPEPPRGRIVRLPVKGDLANDPDALDEFLDDLHCAICDMEGIERPARQGLLFSD
jgi:hypothetical protein